MNARTRALIVHPVVGAGERVVASEKLAEAENLAGALDLDLVGSQTVEMQKLRAGTYFGSGKISEIARDVADGHCDIVVVNGSLSPVQQRNLERAWETKVIDRTGLILEIFGDRARTREGALQVELAHLDFQRSRLVRSWTHLERQRGGVGFLGGPGETQIEADRRALNERMHSIRQALKKVVRTRGQHRAARKRVPFPVVALVGYTNAGKSRLFNKLTGSSVMSKDMLFATLDPTMRSILLPSGRKVILSDTVGFISDLPTELIAAFRATLEEVLDADLIVHVRDRANPSHAAQASEVHNILEQLGVSEEKLDTIVEAHNKIDLLDPDELAITLDASGAASNVYPISAETGQGVDDLLGAIDLALQEPMSESEIQLTFAQGRQRAWLFDHNLVVSEAKLDDGFLVGVRWTDTMRNRFEKL